MIRMKRMIIITISIKNNKNTDNNNDFYLKGEDNHNEVQGYIILLVCRNYMFEISLVNKTC